MEYRLANSFNIEGGGTIPNPPLNPLKTKKIAILILIIILSIVLYSFGLIDFLNKLAGHLKFSESTIFMALILSTIGILLGLTGYGISILSERKKKYVTIGIPLFFVLLLLSTYLLFGLRLYLELCVKLVIIGFYLIFTIVPSFMSYGLFKKKQNYCYYSIIGILFFFIFIKIIIKDLLKSKISNEFILLFIVALIGLIELLHLYFSIISSTDKLMPNKENIDLNIIKRFNHVFYINNTKIAILLASIFGISLIIYYQIIESNTNTNFLNLNFASAYGIWLTILIICLGTFILWWITPHKKTKTK